MDLAPEPDIHPVYPSPSHIASLLGAQTGLAPEQRTALVNHSLSRACLFGDINLLSYLFADPQARVLLNLAIQDEDGSGLISLTILGFGEESDRDVDREECIRLLVNEGADINQSNHSGWTAFHYAALFAPPTLVTYLFTHGADILARTRRNLTALDIIRAHTPIPGREDIALLLEEAMREKGWQGTSLDAKRRALADRSKRSEKRLQLCQQIAKILGMPDKWWGKHEFELELEDEDPNEASSSTVHDDWSSMLVYSPNELNHILQTLTSDYPASLRDYVPAKGIYLLCRFACIWGDAGWIEDLVAGAVDRIEEAVYASSEELPLLTFWMFNCTTLLYFLRSDHDLYETLDILGLFELLEELVNAIFVFLIRSAERQVDPFIETCLLDGSAALSEVENVQFESEWSFFRSLTNRKKNGTPSRPNVQAINAALRDTPSESSISSTTPSRPSSPLPIPPSATPASPGRFSSLRQSIAGETPIHFRSIFSELRLGSSPNGSQDLTTFLSAFHVLLTMTGINPAFIAQSFSQIMYWTACELFNRILTRKKYLCRSRAVQIARNLARLEAWAASVGLPQGVTSHFSPVHELLHWLQSLSSLDDFASLVAIIQALRNLNPFQMRRAVKDYRYEVGEGRMGDECAQYLVQLQKDWERHRVKMGVESMRKELAERDRDDDSSDFNTDAQSLQDNSEVHSLAPSSIEIERQMQRGIDQLFDPDSNPSEWLPPKPPPILGELMESRHMLPLVFPSDSQMLRTVPLDPQEIAERNQEPNTPTPLKTLPYRLLRLDLRAVELQVIELVDGEERRRPIIDGAYSIDNTTIDTEEPVENAPSEHNGVGDPDDDLGDRPLSPHLTKLHPQPSLSRKARVSATE